MSLATKYEVIVACNFHYMDTSEHYVAGEFENVEDALRLARKIVEQSLPEYQHGMNADEMFDSYKAFGEDPFIAPRPDTARFSAWDYAKQRCKEICACDNFVTGDNSDP